MKFYSDIFQIRW